MAQLLLMLIHLQQLRKLYKAMQWVTHIPVPHYEYCKCLEYYLTEDSSVICGGVQGKMQGKIRKEKKSTSWMLDDNACGCTRVQMAVLLR